MNLYSSNNLIYTHYNWDEILSDEVDLDCRPFDKLNGNDVLNFINLFLELYVPEHTWDDCIRVERIINYYLPPHLYSVCDTAYWLAKNYETIQISRVIYSLGYNQKTKANINRFRNLKK